jgi:hypothetical protein
VTWQVDTVTALARAADAHRTAWETVGWHPRFRDYWSYAAGPKQPPAWHLHIGATLPHCRVIVFTDHVDYWYGTRWPDGRHITVERSAEIRGEMPWNLRPVWQGEPSEAAPMVFGALLRVVAP